MFAITVDFLRKLGCAGICNFGIGSPREMPPILAVLRFIVALLNPWGHGYAPPEGRVQTRKAIARNYQDTLGVKITPDQVVIMEGSKPGIRYILQALGLQGEVVLPFPFYPGNLSGVLRAGCKAHHIPMQSVLGFILELGLRLQEGLRPAAVVLSFDNPRWLSRTVDDYRELVSLAKQYGFILISDEAYRDLAFNGEISSITQVDGWEEVAFCLNTASKPFCMAGWKLAALVASKQNASLVLECKRDDSEGGSPAAQKAWATALVWCQGYPRGLVQKYRRRAEFTLSMLMKAGVTDITMPKGGMFVYFLLPGIDSKEFADKFSVLGFEVSPGERFGERDKIRWCVNQGMWVTRHATLAVATLLATSSSHNRAKLSQLLSD